MQIITYSQKVYTALLLDFIRRGWAMVCARKRKGLTAAFKATKTGKKAIRVIYVSPALN